MARMNHVLLSYVVQDIFITAIKEGNLKLHKFIVIFSKSGSQQEIL